MFMGCASAEQHKAGRESRVCPGGDEGGAEKPFPQPISKAWGLNSYVDRNERKRRRSGGPRGVRRCHGTPGGRSLVRGPRGRDL